MASPTRIAANVKARTTAIPLCHVCSYWNFLAASNPSLWSSLYVMWPKRKFVNLVWLWLFGPIRTCFLCFLASTLGSSPVRDILALFISHTYRWQVVNLALSGAVLFRDVPHGATSSLEFFDVAVRIRALVS